MSGVIASLTIKPGRVYNGGNRRPRGYAREFLESVYKSRDHGFIADFDRPTFIRDSRLRFANSAIYRPRDSRR